MITYTPKQFEADLDRLEHGETIVCNERWHDAICEYLNPMDTERAGRFFRECATKPNPRRCGTLDTHLASYWRPVELDAAEVEHDYKTGHEDNWRGD